MMPTEQAFLAAICGNPEDVTPRLVYADWLDERGQSGDGERSEFIRVQCELVNLPVEFNAEWEDGFCSVCGEEESLSSHYHCCECGELCGMMGCGKAACSEMAQRRVKLRDRERELFVFAGGYQQEWMGKAVHDTQIAGTEWLSYLPWFRRGFVEEITLTLADWLALGAELVRAAPLRVVRLTGAVRDFVGEFRRLLCDDEPGDNPVCRLHTLDLTGVAFYPSQLRVSLRGAYRPWIGLRRLILPSTCLPYPSRGVSYEKNTQDEIEQWKKRVPSLESVQFGQETPRGEE